MGQTNSSRAANANQQAARGGIFRVYAAHHAVPGYPGLAQYPPTTVVPFNGGVLPFPPHMAAALPADVLVPFMQRIRNLDAEYAAKYRAAAPECPEMCFAVACMLCGGMCYLMGKNADAGKVKSEYDQRIIQECAAFTAQVGQARGVTLSVASEPYRVKRGKHYHTIFLPFIQFVPIVNPQGQMVIQPQQPAFQPQTVQMQPMQPVQPQAQQMSYAPPPPYDAHQQLAQNPNYSGDGGNKYGGNFN